MNALRRHKALQAIWRTPGGWGRFSAVNHTTIGLRFIVTACVFFAIGGVLAMLIRTQLSTSKTAWLSEAAYAQVFTMHGTVMMFLFAIPLIEGVAIYMLPKLLGARDLAFPRLSAYGYWCYLFGGSLLIAALLTGLAPDGGWFMYTPLTSKPYSPGVNADIWLLGVTFVEISAMCAAVELIVSILKLRAPGMTLDRLPLFAWYMLVTAFMMLLAFPPLILGSILLELERAFDLPFFDPRRGGDPLLWQHLFWLFGHPEVYIIFLPAAGVVSTVLPVFAGRDIIGYPWVVMSVVALGFLSFGLWVHHMFVVGIPHLGLAFFSAASLLVVVPTAIQIFAWIGTLATGKPRLTLPMLWILGFFVIFVIGGLTGVMVAVAPFDSQVHDTHFIVAHLHYVLIGGFVFPFIAGLYYWLPLISGRQAWPVLGRIAFWLIFVGFNLTFLIMHLTGLKGMPRRVHAYPGVYGWDWLNLVSSFGSFVMAFGFALVALDLILQTRYGRKRRRNLWDAGTAEWALPNPVPAYAFGSLPHAETRTPLRETPDLAVRLARGEGYLGATRNGWQETLVVDTLTAEPEAIAVLPRPTFLPLATALTTGLFFTGFLLKLYWLAAVGLIATVALFLAWTRPMGAQAEHGRLPIGLGKAAPPHWETARPPSWWAMAYTLAADASLFASLVFGAIFLRTVGPDVTPPETLQGGGLASLAALLGFFVAGAAGAWAGRRTGSAAAPFLAAALAGHLAALASAAILALAVPAWTGHAVNAASVALAGFAGLHAALGALFAAFGLWRTSSASATSVQRLDLRIGALWHGYAAVTGALAVGLVHGLASGFGR